MQKAIKSLRHIQKLLMKLKTLNEKKEKSTVTIYASLRFTFLTTEDGEAVLEDVFSQPLSGS